MSKRVLISMCIVGSSVLLSGCGTWQTSSSVNVYGRIKHDASQEPDKLPLVPAASSLEKEWPASPDMDWNN